MSETPASRRQFLARMAAIMGGAALVPTVVGFGLSSAHAELPSRGLDESPPSNTPLTKDECKNDGFKQFTNPAFKNQGDCISFVNGQNRSTRTEN